jgi:hypothetical protein
MATERVRASAKLVKSRQRPAFARIVSGLVVAPALAACSQMSSDFLSSSSWSTQNKAPPPPAAVAQATAAIATNPEAAPPPAPPDAPVPIAPNAQAAPGFVDANAVPVSSAARQQGGNGVWVRDSYANFLNTFRENVPTDTDGPQAFAASDARAAMPVQRPAANAAIPASTQPQASGASVAAYPQQPALPAYSASQPQMPHPPSSYTASAPPYTPPADMQPAGVAPPPQPYGPAPGQSGYSTPTTAAAPQANDQTASAGSSATSRSFFDLFLSKSWSR